MNNKFKDIVRNSVLAPNGHNTQAWKYLISDNMIEIYPDKNRALPIVDPNDRELWISLGCALENLIVSAQDDGYSVEITYPENEDLIRVQLKDGGLQSNPLAAQIPLRVTNRSLFKGKTISDFEMNEIREMKVNPGVSLVWLLESAQMEEAGSLIRKAAKIQYSDKAFKAELISWLRFNKKEAQNTRDGLFSPCSGNPEAPRFLGKLIFSMMKPEKQAQSDVEKFLSAHTAVLLASEADDKTGWVKTGQTYERLSLLLTKLNIHSSLMNQPIEIPSIREEMQEKLQIKSAFPQLLLRIGHGEEMPRSLRRSVENVLI